MRVTLGQCVASLNRLWVCKVLKAYCTFSFVIFLTEKKDVFALSQMMHAFYLQERMNQILNVWDSRFSLE